MPETSVSLEGAVLAAVLGRYNTKSRSAILQHWIKDIEQRDGYESTLTSWLKDIQDALDLHNPKEEDKTDG